MNAATRSSLLLIAALALALAPHIANQPPWLGALLAGLLLLRAGQVFRGWRPAPRWLLIVGAVALAVLTFRAHHSLVGRDGGMALLACLIIAKLYEAKNQRDGTVLLMLAYFCMVAFFLISQSPGMAALALASCILTTAALLLQARPQDKPATPLRISGRMVLEAVPIAVLLFLFFPRLPGPLWHMPTERSARSGLSSDMMEPGQISQLALDESVAFRVEFTGAMPPTSSLYWRGPVFETFDGRRWLPSFRRAEPPKITPSGPPVRYTITLEPHQQRWLLALDLPSALPNGAFMSNQLQVLSYQPVSQRQRYSMQSNLSWQTSDDASLRAARSLPAAGNPRARALAASWLNRPPAERVQAALGLLRNGGFTYTLEPPLLTSPDTVDEFLFSSKRGFCEHFAGTFAWLMRAADVPARVVTGYQGGNFNSAGGYLIVRQADAHAWVEVWLEGRGWQRIDPTGQVSPARIDFGLARSVPQGNDLPMMLRDQASWIKNLRLRMDVVANGWNQWVIGYDIDRQNALLRQLGIEDFLSTRFLLGLLGGIGLILGGLALWLLWPRGQRLRNPASRQYRRFCRKLAKAGLIRGAQEGPQDFARRCIIALPEKQTEIERITALYLATRYADQTDQFNALREAIRRFHP